MDKTENQTGAVHCEHSAAREEVKYVVANLAGIDNGMQLLLLLLHKVEDGSVSATGLKNLLEPLCGRLSQQTERLSRMV